MARVLEKPFLGRPETSHGAPWFGPRGGVVEGHLVVNLVPGHARETLDQMKVFRGTHEVAFVREVGGVHDQGVAFPAADRIPGPGANTVGKMRTPIQRDD